MTVTGQVIERVDDAAIVQVNATGCHACSRPCGASVRIRLSGIEADSVRLSLAGRQQTQLMLHTWVLPLCGFVVGALAGDLCLASDLAACVGAVFGLGAGVLMCRPQTLGSFAISEAVES
jgi:positive regulator of sigma E activity